MSSSKTVLMVIYPHIFILATSIAKLAGASPLLFALPGWWCAAGRDAPLRRGCASVRARSRAREPGCKTLTSASKTKRDICIIADPF